MRINRYNDIPVLSMEKRKYQWQNKCVLKKKIQADVLGAGFFLRRFPGPGWAPGAFGAPGIPVPGCR
jgi:hypothetical protein